MGKILTVLLLCSAMFRCPGGIVIEGDGRVLTAGTVSMGPLLFGEGYCYSSAYRGALRAAPDPGERSGGISGEWKLPGGETGRVTLNWSPAGDNGKTFDYRIDFPEPVPAQELSLLFTLPVDFGGRTLDFGKRRVELPVKAGKATLAELRGAEKFFIPLDDGMLEVTPEAETVLLVMDNRAFGQYDYSVRVLSPLKGKTLKSARLRLQLRFRPFTAVPLDLREAANRGFADEKAGDGRGGWNDQGPDNDLSALPAGPLKAGPFRLTIIDGAGNGGRSCIAATEKLEPEAVRVPAEAKGNILYLLHTVAWLPETGKEVGQIEAAFADGTKESISVVSGRDAGNWHLASGLENGMVAWNGSTRAGTPVGLYLSAFELPAKPLAGLRFRASNKAVWMIAAAALGDCRAPFRREMVSTAKRGAAWRPFVYDRSVEAGSALDFSFVTDAPAGKYGFVTVRDDEFIFEKTGEPIRFHGGNLTFETCYPNREQADLLAERLSRIGYNAVRLHHFDYKLHGGNGTDVNPEALDQLEYLVHACKERGIYITLDLYTIRKGWNGLSGGAYKQAIMLIPEAREEFKEFVRNWLTHQNPYTKLRWCDDPVFNSISILNENTLSYGMTPERKGPMADRFRREFAEWAVRNKVEPSNDAFLRFLDEVYRRYYDDMKTFLRELGVKAPLTDQNFIPAPNAAPQRAMYDYVDNHLYWDHPTNYALPFKIRNASVLKERMLNPREIAPSRIFGMPFTVTEYNYCFPNALRAECGPIYGTMAAFQGWAGLYRFTYGTANKNLYGEKSGIEIFEGANDPVQTLGERMVAALFLRGDATEAEHAFPVAVPEDVTLEFRENYPAAAQELMFAGRTGTVLTRAGKPVKPLPPGTRSIHPLDSQAGGPQTLRQEGREWRADFARRTFAVATPRSEALVLPAGQTLSGTLLSAENGEAFGVVSAIALGEEPLAEAGRILLLHLTDVQVEGSEYLENANGNRLYRKIPSVGPLIAHRGTVRLRLRLAEAPRRLYALSPTGKRLYQVPFTYEDGKVCFEADTFGRNNDVIFAYELVCEP